MALAGSDADLDVDAVVIVGGVAHTDAVDIVDVGVVLIEAAMAVADAVLNDVGGMIVAEVLAV